MAQDCKGGRAEGEERTYWETSSPIELLHDISALDTGSDASFRNFQLRGITAQMAISSVLDASRW